MSGSDHLGHPLNEDGNREGKSQEALGNFFEGRTEAKNIAQAGRQVSCWQDVLAWMLRLQTCIDGWPMLCLLGRPTHAARGAAKCSQVLLRILSDLSLPGALATKTLNIEFEEKLLASTA